MAHSRICSVSGCGKPHTARGWCTEHYSQWRTHGNPLIRRRFATPSGEPLAWILRHKDYEGSDCLLWPFEVVRNGYGTVSQNGVRRVASRVMCEVAHGEPSIQGHEAAHSCGNRRCMNPSHIRWDTRAGNHADKKKHGTEIFGERNGSAKLSEAQVREIRSLKGKISQRLLADQYSVDQAQISNIQRGHSWRWLA